MASSQGNRDDAGHSGKPWELWGTQAPRTCTTSGRCRVTGSHQVTSDWSFLCSPIHSFHKYLLSICYVADSVLAAGDVELTRLDHVPVGVGNGLWIDAHIKSMSEAMKEKVGQGKDSGPQGMELWHPLRPTALRSWGGIPRSQAPEPATLPAGTLWDWASTFCLWVTKTHPTKYPHPESFCKKPCKARGRRELPWPSNGEIKPVQFMVLWWEQ
jgi:hypothetical protein